MPTARSASRPTTVVPRSASVRPCRCRTYARSARPTTWWVITYTTRQLASTSCAPAYVPWPVSKTRTDPIPAERKATTSTRTSSTSRRARGDRSPNDRSQRFFIANREAIGCSRAAPGTSRTPARPCACARTPRTAPQPPTTRDVEPERLGEILLRVRRGVRGDVVRQGGGDTATLEVDPFRVGHAVRLAYLPEGPPESPGPGERPIVIEEGVPQLVQNQSGQHVPRDLVTPPPLAGHVAALDLDDLGRPVRHTGNAGAQEHAVVPILEAADDQQLPRPPQRLAYQIAPGGVFAAPRADVHPIVHALVAVRADVLELLVAPFLRAPAPGARPHRVHHAAAAAPLAAPVILEPLGGLERLRARVPVGDVATAPGAVREAVRHHPTAVVTLRAGLLGGVAPLEPATAVRAIRPKPLHFGRAGGTAQLGRRGLALTPSHVSALRPRSAG